MPQAGELRGAKYENRGLSVLRHGKSVSICAWDPERDRSSMAFTVIVPVPDGMCKPCVMENDDKVAPIAARICREEYADKLVPINDCMFKVPATSVRRKKYYQERARVEGLAEQYAAEISVRLSQLVTLDGNCHREKVPAGKVLSYAEYVIADEHDRIRPAAVSKIMWAKPVAFFNRRERLSG